MSYNLNTFEFKKRPKGNDKMKEKLDKYGKNNAKSIRIKEKEQSKNLKANFRLK